MPNLVEVKECYETWPIQAEQNAVHVHQLGFMVDTSADNGVINQQTELGAPPL